MDIIEMLKDAKDGNTTSIDALIKHYDRFIHYELNKYNIQDKITCYEDVKANILKAIYLFKI